MPHLDMPAKRKPLPQSCPQCGKNYGTCRIVVFNPKGSYTQKQGARVILSIGHYSPEGYKQSVEKQRFEGYTPYGNALYEQIKTRSSKEWHNFQLSESVYVKYGFKSIEASKIFNSHNGTRAKSKAFPLTKKLCDKFKKCGYPILTEGAHFLKKGGLKKCEYWGNCKNLPKISELHKWGPYSLCKICYEKASGMESDEYTT